MVISYRERAARLSRWLSHPPHQQSLQPTPARPAPISSQATTATSLTHFPSSPSLSSHNHSYRTSSANGEVSSIAQAQDPIHCEDAASEALIRAILEEERRTLESRRKIEEQKSLELASQLVREDERLAKRGMSPSIPPSSSVPIAQHASSSHRPGSVHAFTSPSRSSSSSSSSLLAYLDLETGGSKGKETLVESITLRVGDRVFSGSFSVPTHVLQNYLRARLPQSSADAATMNKSGKSAHANEPLSATAGSAQHRVYKDDAISFRALEDGPKSMADAATKVVVGKGGTLENGIRDFHQDTAVQRPDSFDSGCDNGDDTSSDSCVSKWRGRGGGIEGNNENLVAFQNDKKNYT